MKRVRSTLRSTYHTSASGQRYWIDERGIASPVAPEAHNRVILPAPAPVKSNACEGGKCGPSGTWSCSKHGAEYQARYGRAQNE